MVLDEYLVDEWCQCWLKYYFLKKMKFYEEFLGIPFGTIGAGSLTKPISSLSRRPFQPLWVKKLPAASACLSWKNYCHLLFLSPEIDELTKWLRNQPSLTCFCIIPYKVCSKDGYSCVHSMQTMSRCYNPLGRYQCTRTKTSWVWGIQNQSNLFFLSKIKIFSF